MRKNKINIKHQKDIEKNRKTRLRPAKGFKSETMNDIQQGFKQLIGHRNSSFTEKRIQEKKLNIQNK